MTKFPCYPCPHNSACCSHGTSLNNKEAEAIIKNFSPEHVRWDAGENGYRTTIQDEHCIFLANNICTIHNADFYPEICSGYPLKQGLEDRVYESEVDGCPEFTSREDLASIFDRTTGKLKVIK